MPSLLTFAAGGVALLGGGYVLHSVRGSTGDYSAEMADATDRIREHRLPLELAEPPAVAAVEFSDHDGTDADGVVPVVTVVLDVTGDPDQRLVWSTVAAVLDAIHAVFEGERVAHYDFQFAHADDSAVCYRRVAVPPRLVERHLEDVDGDSLEWRRLRNAVQTEDDGGETPPVYWREFDAETRDDGSVDGRQGTPIAVAAATTDTGPVADAARNRQNR